MPMIDVYAATGTFADKQQLAQDLAAAVMAVEEVPDIPMFRQNTAAFIPDLPFDGRNRRITARATVLRRPRVARKYYPRQESGGRGGAGDKRPGAGG